MRLRVNILLCALFFLVTKSKSSSPRITIPYFYHDCYVGASFNTKKESLDPSFESSFALLKILNQTLELLKSRFAPPLMLPFSEMLRLQQEEHVPLWVKLYYFFDSKIKTKELVSIHNFKDHREKRTKMTLLQLIHFYYKTYKSKDDDLRDTIMGSFLLVLKKHYPERYKNKTIDEALALDQKMINEHEMHYKSWV